MASFGLDLVPILFVNGKRRGMKVRGRARVNPGKTARRMRNLLTRPYRGGGENGVPFGEYWDATAHKWVAGHRIGDASLRKKRRKGPRANPAKRRSKTAGYWGKHRKPVSAVARRQAAIRRRSWRTRPPKLKGYRRRRAHSKAAWGYERKSAKRGRRARRSTSMARKKRKKRQPAALARYWSARKRSGKVGRPGKTRRSKSSRRRAALKGLRRKGRKAAAPKRSRRKGRKARKRTRTGTRRARRSRRTRRMTSRSHRRRRAQAEFLLAPHSARTVRINPARRRRRKSSRRRGRRTHARRRRSSRRRSRRSSYRRYRRSYRRNPGGMLLDLAKKAGIALAGFYGTRFLVGRIGPMIPGVSALGGLAGPALAVGAVLGVNFATKKVGALARHRNELLIGSALSALDTLFQAFAPASVKSLIGMSDYIQMGDYVAVGGVPPINDSMTLSDYIAVGSDGVEEELGLEEELGVEEELGNDLLGGVSSTSLMKRVPTQSFLAPIPARSFTKVIPAAGSSYDSPSDIYGGIFNGGFGR